MPRQKLEEERLPTIIFESKFMFFSRDECRGHVRTVPWYKKTTCMHCNVFCLFVCVGRSQ